MRRRDAARRTGILDLLGGSITCCLPRNGEDGCQIVEGLYRKAHFPPVHACTIAGEIAARINEQAFEWLDGPIMRVTAHDVPLPYAPTLEDFVLPQTEDVVKAARWLARY